VTRVRAGPRAARADDLIANDIAGSVLVVEL
jgi:hypothetical protein